MSEEEQVAAAKVSKSVERHKNPSRSSFEKLLIDIKQTSGQARATSPTLSYAPTQPTVTIQELIDKERVNERKLRNERTQAENSLIDKNQKLKQYTLIGLFALLFLESATVFVLTFFQGFKYQDFYLDTVTLRIVVVATLLQISAMLTIAVRHLFPAKTTK